MLNRWGIAAALALVCVGVATACGGSDASNTASGTGPHINVAIRLADCTDWKQADASQRLGTVRQLRAFAGGPTGSPAGHGNVLDDKRAYELFQHWCSNYFARGFKLYKLYTRAAAFTPFEQ
jgi:hypothetical protein